MCLLLHLYVDAQRHGCMPLHPHIHVHVHMFPHVLLRLCQVHVTVKIIHTNNMFKNAYIIVRACVLVVCCIYPNFVVCTCAHRLLGVELTVTDFLIQNRISCVQSLCVSYLFTTSCVLITCMFADRMYKHSII
jgi:hypothetical protein